MWVSATFKYEVNIGYLDLASPMVGQPVAGLPGVAWVGRGELSAHFLAASLALAFSPLSLQAWHIP